MKSTAWNCFADCIDDKRFILSKERKEAEDSYDRQVEDKEEGYCTNRTKILESKRLFIRPNSRKYTSSIHDYINRYDMANRDFARLAFKTRLADWFTFCLCLKETDEVIGIIGFFSTGNLKMLSKRFITSKGISPERICQRRLSADSRNHKEKRNCSLWAKTQKICFRGKEA